MKQWEDQQRLKTYNTKIKNAKSSVGTKKLTSSKVNSSMNDSQSISMLRSPGSNSKAPNTPYSDNGSISDYLEWEKFDHTQIPLYKLLQKANLQQYAQQLISRGYGYDLMKFTYLPKREIEILFEDIKVLPGHQTKFHSLIDYIADIGPAILDSSDSRSFTPAMSQKSMFTNTNFIQNNFQSPQQQNHLFTQQVAPTPQPHPFYAPNQSNYIKGNAPGALDSGNFKKATSNKCITPGTTIGGGTAEYQGVRSNSKPQNQIQSSSIVNSGGSGSSANRVYSNTSNIQKRATLQGAPPSANPNSKENSGGGRRTNSQGSNQNQAGGLNIQTGKQQRRIKNIGIDYFRDSDDLDEEFTTHLNEILKLYHSDNESNSSSTFIPNNRKNLMKSTMNDPLFQKINYKESEQMQFQLYEAVSQFRQEKPEPKSNGLVGGGGAFNSKQPNNNGPRGKLMLNPSKTQELKEDSTKPQKQTHPSSATSQGSTTSNTSNSSNNSFSQVGANSNSNNQNLNNINLNSTQTNSLIGNSNQVSLKTSNSSNSQIDSAKKEINLTSNNIQLQPSNASKNTTSSTTANNLKEANAKNPEMFQKQLVSGEAKFESLKDDTGQQRPLRVQDDIVLIERINDQNQVEINLVDNNRLLKNLKKFTENPKKGKGSEIKEVSIDPLNPDLQLDKIKHMYLSYDSGQLTSTLINIDIEEMCYCLSCAILKHIENYQKILNNESMIMDSSFIQEFRNKQTDYYKNKLAEIKEVPGQHLSDQNSSHNDTTTQVDVSGDISKNITNPMQEPTQIQDDYKDVSIDASQYIKGEMNSNSKPANIKRQFDSYRGEIQNILKQSLLMRNYHTNTRDDQGLEQSKLQPQLNIGNEDISILPHQENGNLCSDEDEAQGFDLNASADSAGQQIEGNEFFEVNESEKQSSQELRQRLQAEPDEDEVAYSDEEDKSHSNIMDHYQNAAQKQELDDSSNMYHNRHDNSEDPGLSKSMYEAGDSMEDGDEENQQDSSGLQFSFISQITTVIVDEQNIDDIVSNKRLFEKTFNESDETMRFFSQPNKDVVANYCKNVIITTKMEKEVPIVALVYIERLLITSGFGLTGLNWRQITFTALILASQIWDDESFENDNFARAFPDFTTREINEMERVFLNFIGYSLYVKGSDYAQYYFVLRTFADQNKQSFPLRPLDLQTIIYLQRNSNRAQRSLREAYLNPLNKSF